MPLGKNQRVGRSQINGNILAKPRYEFFKHNSMRPQMRGWRFHPWYENNHIRNQALTTGAKALKPNGPTTLAEKQGHAKHVFKRFPLGNALPKCRVKQ